MVTSSEHGGHKEDHETISVKTQEGKKQLTLRKTGGATTMLRATCGCLCTPENSSSLLTTEK
jgi:hypothetical protein